MIDSVARNTVYPSLAEWATYSAAMLDPAPGLLSTTSCWPRIGVAAWLSTRATTSAAAPGVKPMTTWIGRDGYASCALARRVSDGSAAEVAANCKNLRRGNITACSPGFCDLPQNLAAEQSTSAQSSFYFSDCLPAAGTFAAFNSREMPARPARRLWNKAI